MQGTAVYVAFLDVCKTFDRSKYWLLFDKSFLKKLVPVFIIKLLFIFLRQKMSVQ